MTRTSQVPSPELGRACSASMESCRQGKRKASVEPSRHQSESHLRISPLPEFLTCKLISTPLSIAVATGPTCGDITLRCRIKATLFPNMREPTSSTILAASPLKLVTWAAHVKTWKGTRLKGRLELPGNEIAFPERNGSLVFPCVRNDHYS